MWKSVPGGHYDPKVLATMTTFSIANGLANPECLYAGGGCTKDAPKGDRMIGRAMTIERWVMHIRSNYRFHTLVVRLGIAFALAVALPALGVVEQEVEGSGAGAFRGVAHRHLDKHSGLVGVVSQIKSVAFFVGVDVQGG